MKEFALTLHYYSPQAYEYCRSILKLPDPSSIRNWLLNANIDTSFLQSVLLKLQHKPDIEKDCALIIDSMSIRKQTLYNSHTGKYDGFVDYGPGGMVGEHTDVPASEALVFILVALHSNWKVSIAFFYVDKVQSSIQAQLIRTALDLTADNGIRIRSLTFDGAAANVSMANSLGCRIDSVDNMKCYFMHPSLHCPVFVILDICHMLKLARNTLADLKVLHNHDGGAIKWEYIEKLVKLQQKEGLHLANKLSNVHIQWQKLKMKVKVAAQTLSSSVADALLFLSNFHPDFQDVNATVEFIRNVDMAFDILNTRSAFGKGWKSPLRASTISVWESQLTTVAEYLSHLRAADGQPLPYHRRRTFVLGFRVSIQSIITLSKELLTRTDNSFQYVLTFKFSQDHIECLFSKIRSMGGFNNNPNVAQFKSALRKLLVKQQVSSSAASNCADSDISGAIFELKWSKRTSPMDDQRFECLESEPALTMAADVTFSVVQNNIIYYIGGYVV